jgi:hypothetical protein
MSDDLHDQLVLQIRGAVAEYEPALIVDRMRRGRLAKLRAGQLLRWTRALYGYVLDAERPRDPACVRIHPMEAEIVRQVFGRRTLKIGPACTPSPSGSPIRVYSRPPAVNVGTRARFGRC